jgi:hypothetical protein
MRETKSPGQSVNRIIRVSLWSALGVVVVASVAYVMLRGRADSSRATAAVQNSTHARLERIPEKDRAEAMTRLLASEGCDLVVRDFYQGTRHEDGIAFWSFACQNGRSFMVSVKADMNGSTKIADCAVMKVLGISCFQKLHFTVRRR